MRRGLFTADAAGAEHGNLLMFGFGQLRLHIGIPFAEGGGVRVGGALKCAELHFVIVAGINQQHVGIANQRVPIFRGDVFAHGVIGVYRLVAQRHDLLANDQTQSVKSVAIRLAFAMRHAGETLVRTDELQHGINARIGSGNCGVESFGGEDDHAAHVMRAAFGFQSIAESFAVGEIHETVKGGNRLRHGSASLEGEAIDIWAAGTDGFQTDFVFALL